MESILRSPYKSTLYLDTDTLILKPIDELFDFLRFYDIGIPHRPKCHWGSETVFIDYDDHEHYNTGVILFNNSDSTKEFFRHWKDLVHEQKDDQMWSGHFGDQHYFNELIFNRAGITRTGVKLLLIPNTKYQI